MALTGTDAHSAVIEAIRDIRREEDELVQRLAHGAELVAALRAHESELFRQLAAVRLDSDAKASLAAELSAQEEAVTAGLKTFEGRLQPAAEAAAGLDAELSTLLTRRLTLQQQIGRRQVELDGLGRKTRPTLGSDPAYLMAKAAAERSAAMAAAAATKAEKALAAHGERDRAFRSEKLFMYLFERGFDTGSYRGHALAQRLDSFVAGVIGYKRARQLFTLENELPMRWRDYADRMAELARADAKVRDALESVAVDAAGGKAAREALATLEAELAETDRQILLAEDRRDEAIKTWRDLAQGGEASFTSALDGLSTTLNRHDLWLMFTEARATPKGRDIEVVQQIDEVRQRTRDEAEETREQRTQLRTLAARRRDLEDIAHEMRVQKVDGAESRFDDDSLVAATLNAFLRGEVTAFAYWEQWRQAHRFTDAGVARPALRAALSRPRGGKRSDPAAPVAA